MIDGNKTMQTEKKIHSTVVGRAETVLCHSVTNFLRISSGNENTSL